MGDWGRLASRHPWPIVAGMLALALALASQLPRLTVETSVENFLRRGHPTRALYEEFREQFGRDEAIVLAIEPPEVFDFRFLERLQALHEALEAEVPHLDEVLCLMNARETRGQGDELIVRELFEEWPEDEAGLREIEARARANPLYRNALLSEDGHFTTVLVRTSALSSAAREGADELGGFDDDGGARAGAAAAADSRYLTGAENSEAVRALLAVVERFAQDGLRIHFAGAPVMQHRLSDELTRNVVVFMSLCLLTVGVSLMLLFRRVWAVVLPLVVVLLSIASTFGAMAILGVAIGLPTQILPSFLLAVGVGGAVHLLTIFYQRLDAGEPRVDALSGALEHSGLAIVMTALTTAGGLGSFVTAEIEPVAALGWFAPLGILLGLVYCLVLLPALLSLVPIRARPRKHGSKVALLDRVLLWTGDQSVLHPWKVIACMTAILLVSIAGILRLEFRYDPLSWFPDDEPLRLGTELVDARLKGSFSLEFIVDSGRENGLHDPRVLRFLDELSDRTLALEGREGLRAGRTSSLADIVKEIHQALNEERPEFRRIPPDRQLVSQELLLFESSGSDDLEDVVDTRFQKARFTILLPYAPPFSYLDFIDQVEAEAEDLRGAELSQLRFTSTGVVALFATTIRALLTSMLRSYAIALAIITPLMFLLLGSLRGGLAAMVPNIAPIVLTLGFMGWAGIPLDVFTLLIGSIAIGLAVDDTIHFMHNFRKNYDRNPDARDAVRQTLRTTGRALLITSIVLSLAFFTYSFASLKNLSMFGILTGFTIVSAFLADIGVSPALMGLATRRQR